MADFCLSGIPHEPIQMVTDLLQCIISRHRL